MARKKRDYHDFYEMSGRRDRNAYRHEVKRKYEEGGQDAVNRYRFETYVHSYQTRLNKLLGDFSANPLIDIIFKGDKNKKNRFLRRASKSLLDKLSATASVLSLLGSIFFLSSNITGNVVVGMNQTNSNFYGISFFVLGLLLAIYCLERD
ncbi:hypothetical protein COU57_05585 [Candidatus Pacearchaeota archaeon CG10_big_fil_rev_8_21_14_0_10_32_14]|nr:MAG: hypothetical protein COU57_05585 [Candidatus Pacearchaeota archaeon CG10_big_fil_rev_8_21_14_0_10_32_14]